jgi:hypothetical protein
LPKSVIILYIYKIISSDFKFFLLVLFSI